MSDADRCVCRTYRRAPAARHGRSVTRWDSFGPRVRSRPGGRGRRAGHPCCGTASLAGCGRDPRGRRTGERQRPGHTAVTSIVYLIGAGPRDPGLITVLGLECLRRADVVVYDHEVSPRILRHARPTAELIDVGGAAPKAMAQEAICYLLAEKAREGKVVARLKWGDPFVFDRGGEEALFLHEQRSSSPGPSIGRTASPIIS